MLGSLPLSSTTAGQRIIVNYFIMNAFPCDGNKPITQQFLWEKFSPVLRAYHQLPKIQFKLLMKILTGKKKKSRERTEE